MNSYRIIDIVAGTSVDGPGLRTSIYFAGCSHRCPECHNPQTWDFNAGQDMSHQEVLDVIAREGFNVTFTGGDPVYRSEEIIPLAKAINEMGYNIWLYTGFTFEQLLYMPKTMELLRYIQVVVDGSFIADLRDISLHFRGSSNQRIIDVDKSLKAGNIVTIDY